MSGIDMPNATSPTNFDGTQYVVQLDIFHTLHCLNILRKLVYPVVNVPDDEGEGALRHLGVDQIRQSLQCPSDVSTLYWEWDSSVQRMLENTKTTHLCRNFENIQQWARDHALEQNMDFLEHVPGARLKVSKWLFLSCHLLFIASVRGSQDLVHQDLRKEGM